ncbi:hypothetical protein T484DRAFT_1919070, partial [Baffinella frigidus]
CVSCSGAGVRPRSLSRLGAARRRTPLLLIPRRPSPPRPPRCPRPRSRSSRLQRWFRRLLRRRFRRLRWFRRLPRRRFRRRRPRPRRRRPRRRLPSGPIGPGKGLWFRRLLRWWFRRRRRPPRRLPRRHLLLHTGVTPEAGLSDHAGGGVLPPTLTAWANRRFSTGDFKGVEVGIRLQRLQFPLKSGNRKSSICPIREGW